MNKIYLYTLLFILIPLFSFGQNCLLGDCLNGYGAIKYVDGSRYIGEFEDGKRYGQGVLFLTNGTKYVGSWKNNLRNGEGRIYQNERLRSTGYWENDQLAQPVQEKNYCVSGDCKDGFGIYLFADGRKAIGKFEGGQISNYAICYYPNGDKYVGQWKFQTRNGNGLLYTIEEKQEGAWLDGAFIGATRSIGNKGCVSGNCESGRGTYIYPDNTIYEGNFGNGMAEGYGVCYYADGDIYAGNWKAHKFQGEGTMYYSSGQIVRGFWSGGFYMGEEEAQPERMMDYEEAEKIHNPNGKVWAVLVGIARYNHMRSLKFTDDDAYRLNAFLQSPEGGALPDDQIKVLIDEAAERDDILNTLSTVAEKASKNDVIIFYFSGHGLQGSFLPHDYDGEDQVVQHQEIKDILESSDAKAKIVIADACHSGSFMAAKGNHYETIIDTYYSAFNKSAGGFVLMLSSKGEETSIESNGLRQGIFSHFLIRGLKGAANMNEDQIVTIDELFDYVHNNVRFYTNKFQTPIIIGEYDGNMPLGVVRK
ncbi:MAG: caspase family protein [Saprospiraceae bacterium]